MNKDQWGRLLLRSLISGQVDRQLLEAVGELLVWFAKFNARKDYLSKKCVVLKGSEKKAKIAILKLLDQLLLSEPDNLKLVFGEDCFAKRDKTLLKLRFQRLIKVFHPDRGSGDIEWLSDRTAVINGAYRLAKIEINETGTVNAHEGTILVRGGQEKEVNEWIRENRGNLYWEITKSKFRYWFYQIAGSKPSQVKRRRRLMVGLLFLLTVTVLLDVYIMLNHEKIITEHSQTNHAILLDEPKLTEVEHQPELVIEKQYSDEEIGQILDELLRQTTSVDKSEDGIINVRHKVMNPEIAKMFIKAEEPKKNVILGKKTRKVGSDNKLMPLDDQKKKTVTVPVLAKPKVVIKPSADVAKAKKVSIKKQAREERILKQPSKLKMSADMESSVESISGAIDYNKIEKILSNSIDKTPLTDAFDKDQMPKSLRLMLSDIEISFKEQSASKFVSYFTKQGHYFGERGLDQIRSARNSFFQAVSKSRMSIVVSNYKHIKDWHFLRGLLQIKYSVGNKNIESCTPISILVSFNGQNYKVSSVTKYSNNEKQDDKC